MLRVRMDQAKPGMLLALPIYQPRRHDTILLQAGFELDARSIRRLREVEVHEAWVRYPDLEFLGRFVSPDVARARASLTRGISSVLDAFATQAHAPLDYADYEAAIGGLIDRLTDNPEAAIFIQELGAVEEPALRHAGNVCMLSLLIGLKLGDYLVSERSRLPAPRARDVSNLGVGAMLHDIGMLRLEPETLDRWNRTRDDGDPAWRRHVLLGYEMIQGAVEPSAAAAVLHHHQKFDGSGFPLREMPGQAEHAPAGSQIHIFARIIAVADLFDRLKNPASAPRAERLSLPSIPTVRALRFMHSEPVRRWVDPVILRALLSVVPPYPPGTQVALSNGVDGVVVEWHTDEPCRPTVRQIDGLSRGHPRLGRVVRTFDLRGTPDLWIVRSEGEDVAADNFSLCEHLEPAA